MGIDGKYGQVTCQFGDIGKDEPVIVFRAQDELLPYVLDDLAARCVERGVSRRHVDLVRQARLDVMRWQKEHAYHLPNSDTYFNRITEESWS